MSLERKCLWAVLIGGILGLLLAVLPGCEIKIGPDLSRKAGDSPVIPPTYYLEWNGHRYPVWEVEVDGQTVLFYPVDWLGAVTVTLEAMP